jgi:hypothetical protein
MGNHAVDNGQILFCCWRCFVNQDPAGGGPVFGATKQGYELHSIYRTRAIATCQLPATASQARATQDAAVAG